LTGGAKILRFVAVGKYPDEAFAGCGCTYVGDPPPKIGPALAERLMKLLMKETTMALRKIPSKPVTTTPTALVAAQAPAASMASRSEVKGSGTAKAPARGEITREQIERRAYDIYASRGYAAGDPHADWLEAERQLRAGL
jgi:hypothetical protein